LTNAGKYFSVIVIQMANTLKTKRKDDFWFVLFIMLSIFSTVYSYSWDLYMDWGLLRSHEKGKQYLRPKFLYPRWFYYYAMTSNLFLRFMWVLPLIKGFPDWVYDSHLIFIVLSVAEGFRRA